MKKPRLETTPGEPFVPPAGELRRTCARLRGGNMIGGLSPHVLVGIHRLPAAHGIAAE